MKKSPIGLIGPSEVMKPVVRDLVLKNLDFKKVEKNTNLDDLQNIILSENLIIKGGFTDNVLILANHKITKKDYEILNESGIKVCFWQDLIFNEMKKHINDFDQAYRVRIKRLLPPSLTPYDYDFFFFQDLEFLKKSFGFKQHLKNYKKKKQFLDSLEHLYTSFTVNKCDYQIDYLPSYREDYFLEVNTPKVRFSYSLRRKKIETIKSLEGKEESLSLLMDRYFFDFFTLWQEIKETRPKEVAFNE